MQTPSTIYLPSKVPSESSTDTYFATLFYNLASTQHSPQCMKKAHHLYPPPAPYKNPLKPLAPPKGFLTITKYCSTTSPSPHSTLSTPIYLTLTNSSLLQIPLESSVLMDCHKTPHSYPNLLDSPHSISATEIALSSPNSPWHELLSYNNLQQENICPKACLQTTSAYFKEPSLYQRTTQLQTKSMHFLTGQTDLPFQTLTIHHPPYQRG